MIESIKKFMNRKVTPLGLVIFTAVLTVIVGVFGWYQESIVLSNDEMIETYESGENVKGKRMATIVNDKGYSMVVGDYIWDERDDITYVTIEEYVLDDVKIGDLVLITVDDIIDLGFVYTVVIDEVEVIEQ